MSKVIHGQELHGGQEPCIIIRLSESVLFGNKRDHKSKALLSTRIDECR